MIRPIIPGKAHTGYWYGATVKKGRIVSVTGTWSSAQATAAQAAGARNSIYDTAECGDVKLELAASGDALTYRNIYIIDKVITKPEDADKDTDTIASGEMCVYWEGGEYLTDQASHQVLTGAREGVYIKAGTRLYVDTGTLKAGSEINDGLAAENYAVAVCRGYEAMNTGDGTRTAQYWTDHAVHVQLNPQIVKG